MKESHWNLKTGFYPYGQYIYEHLSLKGETCAIGTWRVNVVFRRWGISEQDTLLSYKLLVLPSEGSIREENPPAASIRLDRFVLNAYFERFFSQWSFKDICNVEDRLLNCNKTYWSSQLHLDSKSDLSTIKQQNY